MRSRALAPRERVYARLQGARGLRLWGEVGPGFIVAQLIGAMMASRVARVFFESARDPHVGHFIRLCKSGCEVLTDSEPDGLLGRSAQSPERPGICPGVDVALQPRD